MERIGFHGSFRAGNFTQLRPPLARHGVSCEFPRSSDGGARAQVCREFTRGMYFGDKRVVGMAILVSQGAIPGGLSRGRSRIRMAIFDDRAFREQIPFHYSRVTFREQLRSGAPIISRFLGQCALRR